MKGNAMVSTREQIEGRLVNVRADGCGRGKHAYLVRLHKLVEDLHRPEDREYTVNIRSLAECQE